MERSTPETVSTAHKRQSVSFLVSLMVICVRHASRVSKKFKLKSTRKRTRLEDYLKSPTAGGNGGGGGGGRFGWSLARSSSPMRVRHEEMLTTLSNFGRKNKADDGGGGPGGSTPAMETVEEEEYGIWQREILMGGKCEPLDYSGVIYYNCSGHQLKELPPRSPRASLVPGRPTRSYVGSLLKPTGNEI